MKEINILAGNDANDFQERERLLNIIGMIIKHAGVSYTELSLS